MRRIALGVVAALVFALGAPAFAQPFSDVPTNHWAYDAIAELAAKGIVEGFPDGTFRGDRAMTRFEMAMIVARLLARIESIQIPAPTAPAAPPPVITPQNLAQIQALVNEFRAELASLGVRVTAVEEDLNAIKARQSNLKFIGGFRFRFDDFRQTGGSGSGATAINGNPRVTATGTDDSALAILPRAREVAKLEFDGSVAPDVHLIMALLTGGGVHNGGYQVFNSSCFGATTAGSCAGSTASEYMFGAVDNLYIDWKNAFGQPIEIWLGRFGGSTQISYGSHPVQFGPFGLLMNTAGDTWEDSTADSGFNSADGLKVAGHWADVLDLQLQGVYIRVAGGVTGSSYFAGEDAWGLDANVKAMEGLRVGAYYVGNSITGGTSPAPNGPLWHLYGPGGGVGFGTPGPNCNATGIANGFQCPAAGNGYGAYVDWAAFPGVTFDGEYAQWSDGVFGTSDNGWQVNFGLNMGTLVGWQNATLQAGYLSYGANFYPPYGNAEADITGNMNGSLYPGNAQGFLGLLSWSPIDKWTVYVSYFSGNSVTPNVSLTEYAAGIRYNFSTRAILNLYTRELKIGGQEQTLIYRAQVDYNF